jgi:hypothetical protein
MKRNGMNQKRQMKLKTNEHMEKKDMYKISKIHEVNEINEQKKD